MGLGATLTVDLWALFLKQAFRITPFYGLIDPASGVLAARERQLARFDGSGLTCNADTPALRRRRSRAVQVWARRTSVNIVSWMRPAKP
jgi:hypothetical protein